MRARKADPVDEFRAIMADNGYLVACFEGLEAFFHDDGIVLLWSPSGDAWRAAPAVLSSGYGIFLDEQRSVVPIRPSTLLRGDIPTVAGLALDPWNWTPKLFSHAEFSETFPRLALPEGSGAADAVKVVLTSRRIRNRVKKLALVDKVLNIFY